MVLIWPTMGYECDIRVCEPFITYNEETNTIEFTSDYNILCYDSLNNSITYKIPQGTVIPFAPVITEYKGKYHQINRSNSWKANYNLDLTVLDISNNPVTLKLTSMSSAVTYTSPEMLPKLAEWHIYGNEQQGRFLTKYPEQEPTYYGVDVTEDIRNNIFSRQLGKKAYELKDHLGNVRVTFSDIKMPTGSGTQPFMVDLLSKSEYYPYGMVIEELSYNNGNTRFGYNGKENDNEIKGGAGKQQDYGMRIYDPRAARFLSQDPITKEYPMLTPYQFASNRPIDGVDLDGLEWATSGLNFHYKDGFVIKYDVKISLVNKSEIYRGSQFVNSPDSKLTQLLGKIENYTNTTYSVGTGSILFPKTEMNLNIHNEPTNFEFTLTESVQNSNDLIWGKTHNMEIGSTQVNNIEVYPQVLQFGKGMIQSMDLMIRTFAHELGHTSRLFHPWSEYNILKDIKQPSNNESFNIYRNNNLDIQNAFSKSLFNLLNSGANPVPELKSESTDANYLSPSQMNEISRNVNFDIKNEILKGMKK